MDSQLRFDEFKEYKELYLFELQRKNDLTNSLSIPIGIVSLILGSLFFIFDKIHDPIKLPQFFQILFIAFCAIFLSIAVYLLIRSYFNYEYGFIPTAHELKRWRGDLIDYYKDIDDENFEKMADEHFSNELVSKYAEQADRNALNNDRKSAFLHNANLFIIAAIGMLFLTGSAFVFDNFLKPDPVYKVIIVEGQNSGVSLMGDQSKASSGDGTKIPTTQVRPPPPPPPPDRMIKEEKIPPKPK